MRNKRKILLFIKVPPPNTGATLMNTYVRDSEIINESFETTLIPTSYVKDVKSLGNYSISKLFKTFKICFLLVKNLLINKPDIIYFQLSPLGIAFLRDLIYVSIIKMFNIKILFHLHGKGINDEAKKSNIKRKLYKYAFKNTQIIFLSNLLTYDLEGLYSGQKHIVPNGIPVFKGVLTAEKKSNADVVNLLFLSNLIISKGILDFIESMYILKGKKVNFNALIIGAEADLNKEELNRRLLERGLKDYCQYIGPKYGKEKYYELQKADVLVFPTKHETFGIVLVEAMQMSTAVISTNEGAIPEIIDNEKTGFIVNKNSPKEIADKVEIIYKDKELLEEMKRNGREKFFNNYTLEHFENNIVNVFSEVLEKSNK